MNKICWPYHHTPVVRSVQTSASKNIMRKKQERKQQNIKILGKGEIDLQIKTNDEVPHPANRRAEISPIN